MNNNNNNIETTNNNIIIFNNSNNCYLPAALTTSYKSSFIELFKQQAGKKTDFFSGSFLY